MPDMKDIVTDDMVKNALKSDAVILLDDTGNLAITDNPHAVAQDVACACSTFLGECWYDSTSGIPYWSRILGHWPGTQLVNATLQQEALKLPTVSAAICQVTVDKARTVTGVLRITDTNNDIFTVLL